MGRRPPTAEQREARARYMNVWRAANRDKIRAYAAKSRAKSPEKARVAVASWMLRNRERAKAKQAEWRAANKRRTRATSARHYQLNREAILARQASRRIEEDIAAKQRARYAESEARRDIQRRASAKWEAEHPEKRAAIASRRRARLRMADGTHTAVEIANLLQLQRGRCAICRCRISAGARHVDHIVPLSAGGTNWISNIQLTCKPCNLSKGAKHPIDFAQSRGLLL